MENRIALYRSGDDRWTLRFGSVTRSVLHVSLVTGRDASILTGLGDSQNKIPNLISALARLDTAEPLRNKF